MNPKILPLVLVVLNVAASVVYFYIRDYRRGLYWFLSAALIVCVTY